MHPSLGGAISDTAIQEITRGDSPPGSEMGESVSVSDESARGDGVGGDGAKRTTGPTAGPTAGPTSSFQGSDESLVSAPPSTTSSRARAPKKRAAPKSKSKFASILAEKHDLLFRMNRMSTRGGKQSRKMSVSDSVDELKGECERMQRELDTEKSIKFQRSLMTSFATGVECINARWNLAGIRLDGWSESIQQDIGSYDEVFEELHAKYATKSVMPPEIKLVMMVASSAFMFHMSKSVFNNMPGMEEAMRDDPEFAKTVAAALAKKAARDESSPEKRGMAGMFAGLMGGSGAGAQSRPLSPPDADSLEGVEKLFSDSEGSEGSVESDNADDDRELILDT